MCLKGLDCITFLKWETLGAKTTIHLIGWVAVSNPREMHCSNDTAILSDNFMYSSCLLTHQVIVQITQLGHFKYCWIWNSLRTCTCTCTCFFSTMWLGLSLLEIKTYFFFKFRQSLSFDILRYFIKPSPLVKVVVWTVVSKVDLLSCWKSYYCTCKINKLPLGK